MLIHIMMELPATSINGSVSSAFQSQTVYTISCVECRRRKIKCDRLAPACSHCLSKKIECQFPSNAQRKIIKISSDDTSEINDKDEMIRQLLQRCTTLEDYLKLGKLQQIQTSKRVGPKTNFLEMVQNIDTRLHSIAADSSALDPILFAKRNFPQILVAKEQDEVLLHNIIAAVSKSFKAYSFFLRKEDVDQFYENFKQETLEPTHFKDSLIMLLLLSICIRLKKFQCVHIPFDKKEKLVEEIFQEYKGRCHLEVLEKNYKCLQIGVLELEFMIGMDQYREDILVGVHEVVGIGKFIKWRDGKTNPELEACWLELQRMDAIIAISFETRPCITDPVNEDLSVYKSDDRRSKMAPIYINTIKILQKYNNSGLRDINHQEINDQIDLLYTVQDLFFLLDVACLYHIKLLLHYNQSDFTGYTKTLELFLVRIWKVSLTDDSHMTRIKWGLDLIFRTLLKFLLHYKEVNGELTVSLSIIICLNNLFSFGSHDQEDIAHKLESYCPKLNFEYCFELITNFEKENPHLFPECKTLEL